MHISIWKEGRREGRRKERRGEGGRDGRRKKGSDSNGIITFTLLLQAAQKLLAVNTLYLACCFCFVFLFLLLLKS